MPLKTNWVKGETVTAAFISELAEAVNSAKSIPQSSTPPDNPQVGDLWLDTSA